LGLSQSYKNGNVEDLPQGQGCFTIIIEHEQHCWAL